MNVIVKWPSYKTFLVIRCVNEILILLFVLSRLLFNPTPKVALLSLVLQSAKHILVPIKAVSFTASIVTGEDIAVVCSEPFNTNTFFQLL